MNPLITQFKATLLSVVSVLALGYFVFGPTAQAVVPAPDGGYPGANTAEGGFQTLFSNTTGINNTAIGLQALFRNTTGSSNTAIGAAPIWINHAVCTFCPSWWGRAKRRYHRPASPKTGMGCPALSLLLEGHDRCIRRMVEQASRRKL